MMPISPSPDTGALGAGSPASGAAPTSHRPGEPYLHAHRADDHVWIDMIWVPPGERRRGVGRALYEEWERALPADVTRVLVFAADTGAGASDGFWERMGFTFRYDAECADDLDCESAHLLWKGVNGHPTPAPVLVPPRGEDDGGGDDGSGDSGGTGTSDGSNGDNVRDPGDA